MLLPDNSAEVERSNEKRRRRSARKPEAGACKWKKKFNTHPGGSNAVDCGSFDAWIVVFAGTCKSIKMSQSVGERKEPSDLAFSLSNTTKE